MALFDYISGTSNWNDTSAVDLGPLSLSVTAGNLVVFIGKWESGGASDAATFTINDGGRGLSWSTPVYVNNGSAAPDGRVGIAWAQVGTTGSASVTGTLSAARDFREFHLHEIEMGASYTPSEIASTTGNSSTAVATWSATSITAAVDDLVAVAVATGGVSFTISATSPLTLQANAQGRSKFTSGKTASSGSTSLGGSITDNSHVYGAVGFQLRVSGGGGGSNANLMAGKLGALLAGKL